jgi:RNA polymerase sigma-70 factor (ECF subfamily)
VAFEVDEPAIIPRTAARQAIENSRPRCNLHAGAHACRRHCGYNQFQQCQPPDNLPGPAVTKDLDNTDWLRGLVAAVALGDRAAFRRLYDATSAKLFGFALRILRKDELADEALQDAFVSIWHAAAGYQPHLAAPLTWMTTIVRNKALDILRRQDDAVELDAQQFDADMLLAMQDPAAGPPDRMQMTDDARALAHCMDTLERRQRQAIGMAYFHDLSHSEVAAQLSLPIGTVKTWIRRGLDKLKTCLSTREAA